jgi:hypothetical protein
MPAPPTRRGFARIAAATRGPASTCSRPENMNATRSSGSEKQTTPQPSMPVAISSGLAWAAAATSSSSSSWSGWPRSR